jgi:IclR family acetate operon transcriptional repressor
VQSVERALDVLEALEDAGGTATVSDVAAAAQLPVPTAYRLARTLVDRGYLRQLDDRRYCLGSRLVPLGAAAASRLGATAGRALQVVAARTGESANLAILSGRQAEYVRQVEGSHAVRMFTEVGHRVPLHSTGIGKALLSTHSDDHVRALLGNAPLARKTPKTITDRRALLADLAVVRRRGYAVDDEEMEVGVRCVAVPIGGVEPMAISVSGPSARMTSTQIAAVVPMLRRAAEQIRRAAG